MRKMTEKEYFEFLEQYRRLFCNTPQKRKKLVFPPALTKL